MSTENSIKIISRRSDLAVIQSRMVGNAIKKKFPLLKIKYFTKKTQGDIDKKTPLSKMKSEGVFTEDIRNELLNKNCDIAVHSWKDLPLDLGSKTLIAGTLNRDDSRDILFIKKNTINKLSKKKTFTVLSSSPRRCYNLKTFLKNYLPFKKEIKFKNIRGNIPTRFKKYFKNEGDILIVAKAAVDRFLLSKSKEAKKKSLIIKKIINKSKWMIVPLSQNPAAPGQGGLAIEVLKKNFKIKKIIKTINHKETYKCIQNERKKLSHYGGGCHQKIGSSYFATSFGIIICEKGELDNGTKFWNQSIIRNTKLSKKKIIKEKIFPKELKNYRWFDRVEINDSIKKINSLKNHCILISRKSSLPLKAKVQSSNVVWTSGMKTWKYLANRKIWVNGSADGMGEDLDPHISSLTNFPWVKLSHKKAPRNRVKNIISTYKLVARKIDKNIDENRHFFWMSSSAFKLAVEKFPKIIKADHACGPGNTYKEINKMLKNKSKLTIYLSYENWKKEIINES